MMDDSQSPSKIMCSWCMCVGRELVEWVVDESACLRLRWDAWLFGHWFFDASSDAEWMRPTSPFIARRECPSCLSSEVPSRKSHRLRSLRASSSIIILYCCLDSWMENNYPGYSRVTVYSFCAVLRRARSYPSRYGYGYSLVWSSTPYIYIILQA